MPVDQAITANTPPCLATTVLEVAVIASKLDVSLLAFPKPNRRECPAQIHCLPDAVALEVTFHALRNLKHVALEYTDHA